jgi:hypothetical protein
MQYLVYISHIVELALASRFPVTSLVNMTRSVGICVFFKLKPPVKKKCQRMLASLLNTQYTQRMQKTVERQDKFKEMREKREKTRG